MFVLIAFGATLTGYVTGSKIAGTGSFMAFSLTVVGFCFFRGANLVEEK